jgi:hypothetical protein
MPGQVAQLFAQALDDVKGWFHLAALDHSAKLSSALLGQSTVIPAGRVAVINDVGEFVLDRTGLSTNELTAMPIYLWNGSDHADVQNDGTSSANSSTVNWYAISPTGVMSGLVATGGYELQTTEFADRTYLPNDLLTAGTDGILTNLNVTAYTTWVCGVASWHVQGVADGTDPSGGQAAASSPRGYNAHGVETLTFWSYFLPGLASA